jgi:crossover junction endodeoxyribonuclease RuvC
MLMLGIDPGTRVSGYSLIEYAQGKTIIRACGFLSFKATLPLQERVSLFHDGILALITTHKPQGIAIETPFLGKNAQNFLKLGYLRGIIYLLSHKHGLTLTELSPREVKLAVTGSGSADKIQVARALHAFFPQLATQQKYDVTDAVAVGLAASWLSRHTAAKDLKSLRM